MSSLWDIFRKWRRSFKSSLPYVRRREYLTLQRQHAELIDAIIGLATPATAAKVVVVKPIARGMVGEVCLFVSFADQPTLKAHVTEHLTHLLAANIQVVLILNTSLTTDDVVIEEYLRTCLSGVLIRENLGFDFGAWSHALSLCNDDLSNWKRLYLINDSIFGPLDADNFARMIQRVHNSTSAVIGLTECQMPRRHLQSYFLVFNTEALHSEAFKSFFSRVMNWPSKFQVIEMHEVRLTSCMEAVGLRCESLFPSLSTDPLSSDDTSLRWEKLVFFGFPYLKTRVLIKHATNNRLKALIAGRPGNAIIKI